MNNKLKIEWLHDNHDCETCGLTFAVGVKAYLNEVLIVDKPAVAHCYSGSGSDAELAGVLAIALEKLGVQIEEIDSNEIEPAKETCYDFIQHYDHIEFIKL